MSGPPGSAGHPAELVVDPLDRIDHQGPGAPGGERAAPYHCPYCASEDLRPVGATPGTWHCRTCTRAFSVKYLGMRAPGPTGPPSTTQVATDPTGGTP
jgi:hypothetical protein